MKRQRHSVTPDVASPIVPLKREAIEQRVRSVRLRHGLTQLEFGQMLGLDQRDVSEFENGVKCSSRAIVAAVERIDTLLNRRALLAERAARLRLCSRAE